MAFEITSDTVVKILVRRGLEIERQETLLSEGELGLSVDSRRLFVGDGYTLGGTPVGSINFGIINNLTDVTPYAQPGDMAVNNNLNYVFYNNSWIVTSPAPYPEPFIGSTLEYSPAPGNALRVSQQGLGDGLLVDYSQGSNNNIEYTIQRTYGMVNFDARFLSLCAFRSNYDLNDGPLVGSLYFGNVFTKTVRDNLSATVNVEKNIFINDHSASAFQLKATARDLTYNSSRIEATSGNLYVTSKNGIYLGTNTNGGSALIVSGTVVTSRNFDVVHSPANDGVNPIMRIGEYTPGSTTLSAFSGAVLSYDETTNTFGISSVGAGGSGGIQALTINRLGNTRITAMTLNDGGNIILESATGSKIGTATSQKLGFYNATPVVQPTAVADATGSGDAHTQLNLLLTRLRTLGLIAT